MYIVALFMAEIGRPAKKRWMLHDFHYKHDVWNRWKHTSTHPKGCGTKDSTYIHLQYQGVLSSCISRLQIRTSPLTSPHLDHLRWLRSVLRDRQWSVTSFPYSNGPRSRRVFVSPNIFQKKVPLSWNVLKL